MTEQLGRRCAVVILAAMTLALLVGLIAWGPVPLAAHEHRYADQRSWLGVPNIAHLIANLPLLAAGLWGWLRTRTGDWPDELRAPWQLFHLCVLGGALVSVAYHAAPGDTGYLLSQVAMSAAFVLLTIGVLAERVNPWFGTRAGITCAMVLTLLLSTTSLTGGTIDLRPFLLLQLLPVLLIPTGVLGLPGRHTRSADWMIMLATYVVARGFGMADALVYERTGWISGHSLMHVGLGCVAGWLAYCAASAPSGEAADGPTQRQTSLNTVS